MSDTEINPPLVVEASLVQVCQRHHRDWALTITRNEQEIDQLLTLLSDLPEQSSYRSLYHRAVDYEGHLTLLKSRFQRLRLDMICASIACMPTERQHCNEPRFELSSLIEIHFRPMTNELNRIKDGCYQFLSVMMTLNLI